MLKTMPIGQVGEKLFTLPEFFSVTPDITVAVTRNGAPVMALLSWELYESISETLEVLADPVLVEKLRNSLKDLRESRTLDQETLEAQAGLAPPHGHHDHPQP